MSIKIKQYSCPHPPCRAPSPVSGRRHSAVYLRVLASLFFAFGLLFSAPSSARWVVVHNWGGGWHSVGWHDNWRPCCGYSGPAYRGGCVFVGGHWENGFWVPSHRVCR